MVIKQIRVKVRGAYQRQIYRSHRLRSARGFCASFNSHVHVVYL